MRRVDESDNCHSSPILGFIFLILVPVVGVEVKGSKRWLDFLFLPRFQPIELLKPFIIIMVASVLSTEKGKNIYYKYFLSFIVIVPIMFLLITALLVVNY